MGRKLAFARPLAKVASAALPGLQWPGPAFAPLALSANWWKVWADLWQIGLHAPMVIWTRTNRFARAGSAPTARDQREFVRMFSEKNHAAVQSWAAMARGWPMLDWSAPYRKPSRLAAIAASGVAPYRRKVKANSRRLHGAPIR